MRVFEAAEKVEKFYQISIDNPARDVYCIDNRNDYYYQ